MSLAELKTRYTADELLSLPNGDRYELVDGQLVEKRMGWEACHVAGTLYFLLRSFLDKHNIGWPMIEGTFQCFQDDRQKVRKPDVSFVTHERMPAGPVPRGHNPSVPDLAVEVISPHNIYTEVMIKVQEYLAAGVRLVWVIDPVARLVHVYRPDESVAGILREDEVLSGEEVLPGFECRVSEVFRIPQPPSS